MSIDLSRVQPCAMTASALSLMPTQLATFSSCRSGARALRACKARVQGYTDQMSKMFTAGELLPCSSLLQQFGCNDRGTVEHLESRHRDSESAKGGEMER